MKNYRAAISFRLLLRVEDAEFAKQINTKTQHNKQGKTMPYRTIKTTIPVFQITCKDRGSMRNFEGSIDDDLFKSSQVDHLFCRVMLQTLSGF